jgi:hypothetical protein
MRRDGFDRTIVEQEYIGRDELDCVPWDRRGFLPCRAVRAMNKQTKGKPRTNDRPRTIPVPFFLLLKAKKIG